MDVHSIFKYTIERNGIHFIPHDRIEQFKKDPLFKNDEIKIGRASCRERV